MKENNKIWYLTPFDPEKRLGHIHNLNCALVTNPDDYICLLDPDTLFLHPHQQAWIQEIVEEHGNKFDLFGCMTNRIGIAENKAETKFHYFNQDNKPVIWYEPIEESKCKDSDIKYHIFNSNAHHFTFKNEIKEADITAGFFMLFKRSLWDKVKFREGINFDIKFCEDIKRIGGKIGIMQGIYLYHEYRSWSSNPKTDKKHLL